MKKINLTKILFFGLIMTLVFSCTQNENTKLKNQNKKTESLTTLDTKANTTTLSTKGNTVFEQYKIGVYDEKDSFIRIDREAMVDYWKKILNIKSNVSLGEFVIDTVENDKGQLYYNLKTKSTDGQMSIVSELSFSSNTFSLDPITCTCTSTDCDFSCDPKIVNGKCRCTLCVSTCKKSSTVVSKLYVYFKK